MKLLINLCAQDGIVSHNSGVGTMVKRYISSLLKFFKEYKLDYHLNLFTPEYNEDGFGFSKNTKKANSKLESVTIYELANGSNGKKFFGSLNNWQTLCKNVSNIINNINFQNYDYVITLANDTPFAGVVCSTKNCQNHIKVWIPHSTAKIHQSKINDENVLKRIDWELKTINFINNTENCFVGVVGKFIKHHLIIEYNLLEEKALDLFNGETLFQETIYEETEETKRLFEKLDKNGDILLSFARPEEYKNLDASIRLAELLNMRAVIITQEYYENMPYVNFLRELAKKTNTNLYVNAPFHFPQYIIKNYLNKILLVVPSKKEIAGLVLNEIRRFNKDNILLVANDIDGLNEQVCDGQDGLLVNLDNLQEAADKISKIFDYETIRKINKNSMERLKKDYDFYKNLKNFLNNLLNLANN